MVRTLIHYRRQSLTLIACAAVATAALSGALLVGDSMHGSLRELALDRLGAVDAVLAGTETVPEDLAGRVEAASGGRAAVVPIFALPTAAEAPASGRRVPAVQVLGVDDRFMGLFPETPETAPHDRPRRLLPPVLLNGPLADELGAGVGDHVLLRLPPEGAAHPESLMGRGRAGTVATLRLEVARVIPPRGPGGFSPGGPRLVPLVALVPLDRLQRSVGQPGRVNTLLAARRAGGEAGGPTADLQRALEGVVTLEDLGVRLREGAGVVSVESPAFFLPPALSRGVEELAAGWGATATPVLTYLANQVRCGERSLPYSTLAALDPARNELRLLDGSPVTSLGPGGILLNEWAARELRATPGDDVALTFYRLDERNRLRTSRAVLRLEGVVSMRGTAADPTLAPEIPGISEAADMASWDPPFPIDLRLIRPRDEEYWETYRATPKGFVAPETGRRLWQTRFGAATSVRVAPGPGAGPRPAAVRELLVWMRRELPRSVDPAALGLSFRGVRRAALEAAKGSTDFAALFLGFSAFLIGSAALLAAMVFSLALEERAREVGVLLALGHTGAQVRRRFLAQGLVLAVAGAVVGSAGAVGYAATLIAILRDRWLPPVAGAGLALHVGPGSLLAGATGSVLIVGLALALTLRRLRRSSARSLLAGTAAPATGSWGGTWPRRVALWGTTACAGVVSWQLATGGAPPGVAFAAGTAALVAGLGAYAGWCGRGRRHPGRLPPQAGIVGLALRNARWNPGRSVFGATVVASACFVLVTVAIHRHGIGSGDGDDASADGGFTVLASSSLPLYHDLGTAEGREELGLTSALSRELAGWNVYSLRANPGDDSSCLNPYRPQDPRVLGLPDALIERGGFRVGSTLTAREGLPPTDEPLTLLRADPGPGVVPAIGDGESVRWILHSGLGEEIEVPGSRGRPIRLRLVALLADTIFQSELLVSEERFLRHFGAHEGFTFFLLDPPAERAEEVSAALDAELARFGFDARPSGERLAAYHSIRRVYLAAFQLLGGIGLGLGVLGLGVVVARNLVERAPELATLRAVGFRRRELIWMLAGENISVVLAGIAIGTLAGLVASAPHLAAGGGTVAWGSVAGSLGAIGATGLLASVGGAMRLLTMPLASELRPG